MTTYSDLIEECISDLQGFTVNPDQLTFLTADIAPTDMTFTVSDASQIGTGIVEIDQELMWVTGSDAASNTITVGMRAFRGTVPVLHTSGSMVTMTPSWPRSVVARTINNVILSVYPMLFAVKTAPLITADPNVYQYNLPAGADRVVDVRYFFDAQSGWQRATKWESEQSAPAQFAGGAYFSMWDNIIPGSSIQVLYASRPSALSLPTDDFAAVSGLAQGTKDLVVLGVMAQMVQFAELARIPVRSVAATDLAPNNPVGTATNISRALQQAFQQRVLSEQMVQSTKYPPRVHRTR